MSDSPQPRQTLTDLIRELTDPYTHRQPYQYWTPTHNLKKSTHPSRHPSLLRQLRNAITDRPGPPGQKGNTPRYSADAQDRYTQIASEVNAWLKKTGAPNKAAETADRITMHIRAIETLITNAGIRSRRVNLAADSIRATAADIRDTLEPNLRALAEAAAALDPHSADARDLHKRVEHWHTWCRIFAGWADHTRTPNARCPVCDAMPGDRAGLRIRIDAAAGTGGVTTTEGVRAAVCLSCNETWNEKDIGLLSELIRAANGTPEDPGTLTTGM